MRNNRLKNTEKNYYFNRKTDIIMMSVFLYITSKMIALIFYSFYCAFSHRGLFPLP